MTYATESRLITDWQPSPPKKDRGKALAGGVAVVTAVVVGMSIMAILGAWYAFVLWKLYGWFVVPLGAPPLNWWHIWGLTIFAGAVVAQLKSSVAETDGSGGAIGRAIGSALGMVLVLLVGWIISGQI